MKFDKYVFQIQMEGNNIEVDQEPLASTVTEGMGKVKKPRKTRKRKGKDEKKTKAANPFGQFLKHKHATEGKVDFKKACQEWANESDENKDYFRKNTNSK